MNDLLDKYWEGNTSLKEEQQLRDYFYGNDIADEHKMYSDLFATYKIENEQEGLNFDAFAKVNPKNKQETDFQNKTWKGLAIAAGFSLLIAVGANYFQQSTQPDLGTYDTPEQAYAATVEALELVSLKFNNGRNNLVPAAQVNKKTTQIFKLDR
jgi:hypothetical protein